MSFPRSRRGQAGHLLVEALAAGALLSLTLAALASGEIAAQRSLLRDIDGLEMVRVASERLEYLRAHPTDSPVWQAPSGGLVPGHPGWGWTIVPVLVEDGNVSGALTSFRYLRATVTITTEEGRTVVREALRW